MISRLCAGIYTLRRQRLSEVSRPVVPPIVLKPETSAKSTLRDEEPDEKVAAVRDAVPRADAWPTEEGVGSGRGEMLA